jgi:HKD family nuclease
MEILIQPYTLVSFGETLNRALRGEMGAFNKFSAAIAFVKSSGVRHIEDALKVFFEKGGESLFISGIDRQGTSHEGLENLMNLISEHGELFINYCSDAWVTFHPKVYFFEGQDHALLFVGSGNLTQGGLYMNDEAFLIVKLNLSLPSDTVLANQVREVFEEWKNGNGVLVDDVLLTKLLAADLTVLEAITPIMPDDEAEENIEKLPKAKKFGANNPDGIFKRSIKPRLAPRKIRAILPQKNRPPITQTGDFEHFEEKPFALGFVMILRKTDVGMGQTTSGKGRRSPEIFIPLAARDFHSDFWGWQELFEEDSQKPGKFDRRKVRCRVGGEIVEINMMTWPDKSDFRLRSERLRSAGNVGDILRIEKTGPDVGFDYYVEIIPPGTSTFEQYLEFCTQEVRNSDKRWGYYGF